MENKDEEFIKAWIGEKNEEIYEKMNHKFSFSWQAAVFTDIILIGRKMFLETILVWVVALLLAFVIKNEMIYAAIIKIGMGFLFYPLYKFKIQRKINKLKQKNYTDEEILEICKKKGGQLKTSAWIIIIILAIIVCFIAAVGWSILNSATSSSDNSYISNGVTLTYGEEWSEGTLEMVEAGTQYKAIANKKENLILICTASADCSDDGMNYTLSAQRRVAYNQLYSLYYSQFGSNLIKGSMDFLTLEDSLYYAYFDCYNMEQGKFHRIYIVLDTNNNMSSSFTVISNQQMTTMQEQNVNEVLKTIKF